VNRISLGAQSFDAAALRWMHRGHDGAGVQRAVEALRAGGIANWSLDLIFNLPHELGRDWSADIDAALALAPAHVSLYGLTIESHTPLARWRERGETVEGDEDAYAAEFLLAHERLESAGYAHYEVSNFALPGRRSRHNSAYWSGVPYVGLGPSAHGFDGDERRWNEPAWARWAERVAAAEDPVEGSERLGDENRAAERVYLGLRTEAGLELEPADAPVVAPWIASGWAERAGTRFRLTPPGWLRLDALAASLTVVRSR
jgi:oxygen-independent coproporphyrinogen-3 oxidase